MSVSLMVTAPLLWSQKVAMPVFGLYLWSDLVSGGYRKSWESQLMQL